MAPNVGLETGRQNISDLLAWAKRTVLSLPFFLGLMGVLTAGLIAALYDVYIRDAPTSGFLKAVLLASYVPLFFSNMWMLVHGLYYPFIRLKPLKEVFLSEIPPTALIFFIRKETAGLYERMEYSFRHNDLPGVDLWIVSGEGSDLHINYELSVFERLRARFGADRVFRLHSDDPANKKREMMDVWLDRYTDRYKYFFPCDADSLIPQNCLLRLLRKAEHPDNAAVGTFQSNIAIAGAATHFANNNRSAVSVLMEYYLKLKQIIFGEMLCFGHNYLSPTRVWKDLRIPPRVLSHDIFDTVYTRRRGYKTVFCHDVISFEESPANYVEERKRNIRWMRGDYQSISLLYAPDVPFPLRFLVYFNIHNYLAALCFFTAFNIGIFWDWGAGSWIQRDPFLHFSLTYGILFISVFNSFFVARSWRDVKEIFYQVLFSTIVSGNSSLYTLTDSVLVLSGKQGWSLWDPMRKDPREGLSWGRAARALWPSTVIGLVWCAALIARGYYRNLLWGLPIIASYALAIPLAYFSAKEMKSMNRGGVISLQRFHRQ